MTNKTVDELTPKELKKLLDKKEKTPIKVGYLKCDMYSIRHGRCVDSDLCTKEGRDNIVEKIRSEFKIDINKGQKFLCYIDSDDDIIWREEIGGSIYSEDWVEKYLEKIEEIK